MKRAYVTREEISHPDNMTYRSMFTFGLIDIRLKYLGKDTKEFEPLVLSVKSRKTGNESRLLGTSPIEIEGLSGIYRMTWSNRLIRKRERVFNHFTGKEYRVTPIARVKYTGYVIYSIEELTE